MIRARRHSWIRRLRTRVTRAGKLVVVATLASLGGLVLAQHPALVITSAFLLSLLLLSVLSGSLLRRIQIHRLQPGRFTEGESGWLEAEVEWPGRWPALALEVSLRADNFQAASQGFWIAPRPHIEHALWVRGLLRGHVHTARAHLKTSAPFGLIRHQRELSIPCDTWVFPLCRTLRETVLEEMLRLRPRGLDLPQPVGPGESEFYALREFREGDPERRVHHRLSARLGRKVLREFRGEAPPRVDLILDVRVPMRSKTFIQADFEESLRFVAGIVRSLLIRSVPVTLRFLHEPGDVETAVQPTCRDLHGYLSALARVRPDPTPGDPEWPGLPALDDRDERHVLVHQGMVPDLPPPAGWLVIQAGSQRYYRLLQPQYVLSRDR